MIQEQILSVCLLDSDNLAAAIERGVQASWFTDSKLFADLLKASLDATWNPNNSVTILQGAGVFKKHPQALQLASEVPEWAFSVEDVGDAIDVLAIEHSRNTLNEQLTVARNRLVEGDDPFEVAGTLVGLAEEIDVIGGGDERTTVELCADALEIDTKIANGERVGLPFPWVSFQARTFGIPTKAVTPMGGRDGAGKSRLATFLTHFWVSQGIPILYFAFEDSAERFVSNVAASHGEYDMFTIKRHHVPADFMPKHENTLGKVSEFPLYVEDYPSTAEKLVSLIARYKRKYGIEGVVIDGFKDMIPTTGENQTTKENHMTAVLVRACKRYEVAIIPISHINKIDDEKRISKSDITGAGNQFKSARMVLLYQDHVSENLKAEYGVCGEDVILLDCTKCSYGNKGKIMLRPELERGRFVEVMKEEG